MRGEPARLASSATRSTRVFVFRGHKGFVRMALRQLGAVIGTVGVEDILGAVFSQFCIGK